MATTLNGRTALTKAPKTYFKAPNGVNNNVSACTGSAAELASYFVNWWDKKLEHVHSCNGWRPNNDVNPRGPQNSNHLSASAWDVNGYDHLYELYHQADYKANVYKALGFNQDQLDAMRKFSNGIEGLDGRPIFRLGIDFDKPYRDPMHFEVAAWTSDADLVYAAARIGADVGTHVAKSGVLQLGDDGPAVKALQLLVGVGADGVFGPNTEKGVKRAQRIIGATADGVWGKASGAAYKRFCDGSLGSVTWNRWMQNAGVKSRKALIRKIQVRSQTLKSVQPKCKIAPRNVDGVLGPKTWKAIQDGMGLTDIDGIPGKRTISALQARIVRGRW